MTVVRQHKLTVTGVAAACLLVASIAYQTTAGAQEGQIRPFSVKGDQFAFSPGELSVKKDDLIKVTFTAVDIPHSFTIDGYRIAKRAGAGQSVTFEFRADQSGEFEIYCNLAQDDRCRHMKGKLLVK